MGKAMIEDVVCLMEIDPETAVVSAEHDGEMFYFCSHGCGERPDRYLKTDQWLIL